MLVNVYWQSQTLLLIKRANRWFPVIEPILKKNNIPFESWAGEKNTYTNRVDGVKQIYFKDPDGYWIEINDARE